MALLRRTLIPREVTLDSLATVVFSSGSTGTPKGVMLTHRNIISNVEGMLQAINVDRNDCLLGVLPFFHSFGFTVGLWLPDDRRVRRGLFTPTRWRRARLANSAGSTASH